MNFEPNDDQRALQRAVEDFIRTQYSFQRRRDNLLTGPEGRSASWQDFADMGLLGLLIPDTYGGSGLGAIEASLVMEQFGRALVVEPFCASALVATQCLLYSDSISPKDQTLSALARGASIAALASAEFDKSTNGKTSFQAQSQPDGWLVTGRQDIVTGADHADIVIVHAVNAAAPHESILFLIERNQPGVTLSPYRNHDGTGGAAVSLDRTPISSDAILARGEQADHAVSRAHAHGIAAVCAEAVGIMAGMLDLTLEHLRTRKQFGTALSAFQALRHRAVDMLLALERARSMATLACIAANAPASLTQRCQLSAVKVQICQSARFVGQQAIQLHGGMGVTDEYLASHYFRRLTAIEHIFGDLEQHLDVLNDAGGISGMEAD